jgi:Leucine-rich repeat (LRR) protein
MSGQNANKHVIFIAFIILLFNSAAISQKIKNISLFKNFHYSNLYSKANIIPDNPNPPDEPVRLIFIHHSTGGNWLADDNGGLGIALKDNKYYVSDVSYGWGPGAIGDKTDLGNWWEWFRDPEYSSTYLDSLYNESGKNSPFGDYSRLINNPDPAGKNVIIMFKSCFPNSALKGNINDPVPAIENNPLRGQSNDSENHTIANAKGIYIDILEYFKTRQDKLFIVITQPPLSDGTYSSNARAFTLWLVKDWLKDYPYKNVFVFDFFNILTTNGGNSNINDLGSITGNHHRWFNGAVQYQTDGTSNTLAYPSDDDHPSRQGNLKATAEFLPLLNVAYNRWKNNTVITSYYKVSGTITLGTSFLSGVSVRLTGNGKDTTSISNQTGKYEFTNLTSGSYTITPEKANYSFIPSSYTINLLTGDSVRNFTAAAITGVKFNDSNLEKEIRNAINKQSGEITESDMASLTEFTADNKNITDLTGLEKAVNLTYLNLNNNNIININPITGLTKLTNLILYDNQISNIDSLGKLTNLTYLLLGYNPVKNLSGLSSLKNLTVLHLPAVQANSFSPLSELKELTELNLESNNITDIYFLSGLINLSMLYLNDNRISDITPLNFRIIDIFPLAILNKLTVLNLSENLITNISSLSGLTELTQLYLTGNGINDLSPLKNLAKLTDLDISSNRLSDISLSGLYNLKQLSNSNIYTDISGDYKTGYLDLRENVGFSQNGIKSLDTQLTLLNYDHILWNTVSVFYNISGSITAGSAALPDVSIRLKGKNKDTTILTDNQGAFTFSGIPAGDIYVITPTKSAYTFTPKADTLGVLLGDSIVNFSAQKTIGVENLSSHPLQMMLFQNYPNPFNPMTVIGFELSDFSFTTLKIYDILGREIKTLINENMAAGKHSVQFDASRLASGIYYYKILAGNYSKTMKMVLTR